MREIVIFMKGLIRLCFFLGDFPSATVDCMDINVVFLSLLDAARTLALDYMDDTTWIFAFWICN